MVAVFQEVWTSLTTYIVGLFPQISNLFVTATTGSSGTEYSITFVGVLAVIMAGISLILLVFNLIRSFLAMRG